MKKFPNFLRYSYYSWSLLQEEIGDMIMKI